MVRKMESIAMSTFIQAWVKGSLYKKSLVTSKEVDSFAIYLLPNNSFFCLVAPTNVSIGFENFCAGNRVAFVKGEKRGEYLNQIIIEYVCFGLNKVCYY